MVGAFVGAWVGALVGDFVGVGVGAGVGEGVGVAVGAKVGFGTIRYVRSYFLSLSLPKGVHMPVDSEHAHLITPPGLVEFV